MFLPYIKVFVFSLTSFLDKDFTIIFLLMVDSGLVQYGTRIFQLT